jgi:membrane-associated protease RseP (regulator of RpoE activity)
MNYRAVGILLFQFLLALGVMEDAFAQAAPQERWACLQQEDHQVERNKVQMDQLFRAAMERYKGAQSCVGVWARNLHGPGFSVCGKSEPHFVLGPVQPDSGASDAGLREGDILLSINEFPVKFHLDFEVQVLAAAPGTIVSIATQRDGKILSHQVIVGLLRVAPDAPLLCSSGK